MADNKLPVKPVEETVPIAKPSDSIWTSSSRSARPRGERRDTTDGNAAPLDFAGERLRPAAPGRGKILVARTVFCQRADQGAEEGHAAPDRGRIGDAVLAERKNSALPLGAGDQAIRRVLSLPRADQEHRQPMERDQSGGVRTEKNHVGAGDQSPRGKRRRLQGRLRARAGCLSRSEMANAVTRRIDRD